MIHPGSTLVVCTWLATQALPCDGVGDTLPADPRTWSAQGWVHVPLVVGGSPQIHIPMRQPIVQIDTYTNRPESELAPWGRADHLAAAVLAAAHAMRAPVTLAMPGGYPPVRLHSIWALSEPRRIPSDPAAYARVSADYETRWTVLT